MNKPLVLVSHLLCPYVQRARIVLQEKGLPFEVRYIDLANKPDWFLAISPLGKTPVLLVGDTPLFESAAICEYLDEVHAPRLHPDDALLRAQERGWMEFGSATLDAIGGFYAAPDEERMEAKRRELAGRFARLEAVLGDGPWFAGTRFGIVDAVFGPLFRYFDTFEALGIERLGEGGFFDGLTKVPAWRARLAARPSVIDAVTPDYPQNLAAFLRARSSALGRRLA